MKTPDEKLLHNFLNFLWRRNVELIRPHHESGMVNLTWKEQRNLARQYLTKKRK